MSLNTCSPDAQKFVRSVLPATPDNSLITAEDVHDAINIDKGGRIKINDYLLPYHKQGCDHPVWLPPAVRRQRKRWPIKGRIIAEEGDIFELQSGFDTFPAFTVIYFYAIPTGYSVALQLYESNAIHAEIKTSTTITQNQPLVIQPSQSYAIQVSALPSRRRSSRKSGLLARLNHSRRQKARLRAENKKLRNSLRYVVLFIGNST